MFGAFFGVNVPFALAQPKTIVEMGYHHQPGTPLQLRDDSRHLFEKMGYRESMYAALRHDNE
jgi:hypothetical protein